MQRLTDSPWNGSINWNALRPYKHVLARRAADQEGWVIAIGPDDDSGQTIGKEPWAGGEACFGHVSYDLKNNLEHHLQSRHPHTDGFGLSAWWKPRFMVVLDAGRARLDSDAAAFAEAKHFLELLLTDAGPLPAIAPATWIRTTPRDRYMEQVQRLLGHIQRGDIYEVNYCTQRTACLPTLNPYAAFTRLLAYTDAPFAAFYRAGNHFALCASPERFLRIEGPRIITQPMKGTRPRGRSMAEDSALAQELATDAKERSENIMALDVARNDLSRVAASGTVQVNELCAVKSYPAVHQMVSTASARLRIGITPMDILRATFPMASMTGAPKVRAMELIDDMEDMRRGLFSGTIGYFLPNGIADLNVVIRTVSWNAATGWAALISGGAITAASTPEQEFAECEHKAHSVLNALGHAC